MPAIAPSHEYGLPSWPRATSTRNATMIARDDQLAGWNPPGSLRFQYSFLFQVRAITEFQRDIGPTVYYHLYNPWRLPYRITRPRVRRTGTMR